MPTALWTLPSKSLVILPAERDAYISDGWFILTDWFTEIHIWGGTGVVCPDLFKYSILQITKWEKFPLLVLLILSTSLWFVIFHYFMILYIFQMYIYQSQYEYKKWSYWLYFGNFLDRPYPYQTKASWDSAATAVTSGVKCVRQVLINVVCYTITSAGMGMPHDRCHGKAQDWMFSLNCIGFPCYLFSHTEMRQNYISHSIKVYIFHVCKEINH